MTSRRHDDPEGYSADGEGLRRRNGVRIGWGSRVFEATGPQALSLLIVIVLALALGGLVYVIHTGFKSAAVADERRATIIQAVQQQRMVEQQNQTREHKKIEEWLRTMTYTLAADAETRKEILRRIGKPEILKDDR